MTTAPALPTRPFTVMQTRQLPEENDAVDVAWPLWGWLTSDVDLVIVGLAVFDGRGMFIMGYDPDVGRWSAISKIGEMRVSEPDVLWDGLEELEAWLYKRFEWEQLTRI